MAEPSDDLKKLLEVAADLRQPAKLRTQAIKLIGNISTYDALRSLLDLAANEKLTKGERELALKYAREIIKSGP